MNRVLLLILLLGVLGGLYAETFYVPEDYQTIQGAIDGVTDGDIVIVSPGTYEENLNFNGKAITLGSYFYTTMDSSYIPQTIIDGSDLNSVVVFENAEDTTSVLTGFTIANGHADEGGGIRCYDCSPRICNLIIRDNWALAGGGVHLTSADAVLSDLLIRDNTAMYDGAGIFSISGGASLVMNSSIINNTAIHGWGGGILSWESDTIMRNLYIAGNFAAGNGGGIYAKSLNEDIEGVKVVNNDVNEMGGGIYLNDSKGAILRSVICDNIAGARGGGLYIAQSGYDIINVTIANNNAGLGGGIFGANGCNLTIVNTIMWSDYLAEIYFEAIDSANSAVITYSDIAGGEDGIISNNNAEVFWLEGNIDSDPIFDELPDGEYHLLPPSPCIDSGTIFFEIEEEVLVDMDVTEYWGISCEMGAYEYEMVDIDEVELAAGRLKLTNYPNPFYTNNSRSGITRISFHLENDSHIALDIYNCRGRKIKKLLNKNMIAGDHQFEWDGRNAGGLFVATGVYFYKLAADNFTQTRKLLLIR
jgi:FlgD Ig-like domain/Chlamydia polymorphic membrane protein (Chlamydia_PMP) repeat